MATQFPPSPESRPKRPKPLNHSRPLSEREAQAYTAEQTFYRYTENRSQKRPRKWLITYQLIEGPPVDLPQAQAVQPKTRPPEPPVEEEPTENARQEPLFDLGPPPTRRTARRRVGPSSR